ncbi:MAG: thioredoxin family protein [Salinarchaeum sp.]
MAGESNQVLAIGDRAPDFELPGTDEATHTIEDFTDNAAILVVFTCNHCPYAQAKLSLLNDIAIEHDDVAVVGINPNDAEAYPEDSFEEMQARVASGEAQYDAYLRDESQEVAKAYGAVCTPDPFLFAVEDGETRLAYQGRLDDAISPGEEPDRIEIHEAIEAVLAGEDVDIEFNPSRGCTIKWHEGNKPEYTRS